MITTTDIAWLAGIIEGEGCFSLSKSGWKRKSDGLVCSTPTLSLSMTDKDVVDRVASFFGSKVFPFKQSGVNRKPTWQTRVYGKRAIAWAFTLYSFLGSRRRKRIEEILDHWKKMRAQRVFSLCHPERKHAALGKCVPCYNRDYWSTRH